MINKIRARIAAMSRRQLWALSALILALALFAGVLVVQPMTDYGAVGATAITTPAAVPPMSTDNTKDPFYFWATSVITQSGASSNAWRLQDYEVLDLHCVLDATLANTTTIKLQYSNDNVNWADGHSVIQNTGSDQNDMVQRYNFGAYTRLYATVTNSNPLTVTVVGIAR